ncbi:hypothetical protein QBC42DRAFT_193003 [Cladorrhinum samala]|uniref:FAD-binding PCMH-type domain-containing protein n=1 Tax=Cladorrhinum samala TaxID=585594 RepID=A0AAV9I067_9PEZI|nr:hypothetical protein QBC42DRAFT_193003 [Cladorrhinum samala]
MKLLVLSAILLQDFANALSVLTESDVSKFAAVSFADHRLLASRGSDEPRCKIAPEDASWPTREEWAKLNATVDGALLKPDPSPSVCYPSHPNYNNASCAFLTSGAARQTRFWLDDPLSVLSPWTQGNTCLPVSSLNATTQQGRTCTQGGFPAYVVNATEVKHIQAAVNFARNKNIRLIIKNTGHDFLGRSNGYGSLSVWTHHLKALDYSPRSTIGSYTGPVVKVGSGVETWEANNAMIKHNFTMLVPKLPTETVGLAGGWFLGGGHSNLASKYGLGADHVLQIEFVTADGKFLTASKDKNQDYFFALRGGGGSTFAIVTSVYFRAFPGLTTLGTATFTITTGPAAPSTSQTATANTSLSKFWAGVGLYLAFAKNIVNAGGFGHGDVTFLGNDSFSFTPQFLMPGMSAAEVLSFISPLLDDIQKQGINFTTAPVPTVAPYAEPGKGINTNPGAIIFSSRLIPRSNWDNDKLLSETIAAIRRVSEAGFNVRTRAYAPSLKVAGDYAAKAINPAMREMVLHTTVFSVVSDVSLLSKKDLLTELQALDRQVEKLRKVTPGSGAYFNEAGRLEPNWQQSFFGKENYKQLLKIKKKVDPSGLFWAPMTVGSEGWSVETADGLPTGDGRLCRVGGREKKDSE